MEKVNIQFNKYFNLINFKPFMLPKMRLSRLSMIKKYSDGLTKMNNHESKKNNSLNMLQRLTKKF